MLPLSATTTAYIAGILDGEGCLSLHGRKSPKGGWYSTPSIQVTNTSHDLVEWLYRTTGVGHLQRRRDDKRLNRKPTWCWFVAGQQARDVITAAYPFLLIKRPQADVILDLQAKQRDFVLPPPIKGMYKRFPEEYHALSTEAVRQIRLLNKRGREAA